MGFPPKMAAKGHNFNKVWIGLLIAHKISSKVDMTNCMHYLRVNLFRIYKL